MPRWRGHSPRREMPARQRVRWQLRMASVVQTRSQHLMPPQIGSRRCTQQSVRPWCSRKLRRVIRPLQRRHWPQPRDRQSSTTAPRATTRRHLRQHPLQGVAGMGWLRRNCQNAQAHRQCRQWPACRWVQGPMLGGSNGRHHRCAGLPDACARDRCAHRHCADQLEWPLRRNAAQRGYHPAPK